MAASCSQALKPHVWRPTAWFSFIQVQSWSRRSVCQQASAVVSEEIIVPRKKTWSKEAVLQALNARVQQDPTAADYRFQDDPYLTPRTSGEFKLFSLSQESGRNAARFFINTYPKYFQKDYAQPHVPCLMPVSLEPGLEEASEAALLERIRLRRVKASVELYDQMMQAGTPVSLEVTNQLLDLICYYGDQDPAQENVPEQRNEEMQEDAPEGSRMKRGRAGRAADGPRVSWKENNNAERILSLLAEPDSRSFSAVIRGAVKHGACSRALSLFTELQNRRLRADVHTFNALIAATPDLQEKYSDKWQLILDLLKQMCEQRVRPDLQTFNSALKALRRCGSVGRSQAFGLFSEMKALSIEPSLASYNHLLCIFYKAGSPPQGPCDVLQEVLSEVKGRSFTPRDPDDAQFFITAMRVCLDTKDVDQAYRLQQMLQAGEHWRMLGDAVQRSYYYSRFFSLLCMMESVDVVLRWYQELVPSVYFPTANVLMELLQALDADGRLALLPQLWRDIKNYGHGNKQKLVEELLSVMAREKQTAEVQEALGVCALEVKRVYQEGERGKMVLSWTASSLTSVTRLLLAAQRRPEAWDTLQLFSTHNRVPSADLLQEFLTCVRESADVKQAMELLKFSTSFCLSETPALITRVHQEFQLTPQQLSVLSDLEVQTSSGE